MTIGNLLSMSMIGKVALIIGGTQGIGKSIVKTLADHGVELIVVARDLTKLKEIKEEIMQKTRITIFQCDIGKMTGINRLLRFIETQNIFIDYLINNAAVNYRVTLQNITEEIWDEVINTNLKSYFFLSQGISKYMDSTRISKIINISSIAGVTSIGTGIPYAVSKSGVIHLTKVLAAELADMNIQVNCIAPGFIDTQFSKEILSQPDKKQGIVEQTLTKKIGTPSDISKVVLFLLSGCSDYMTGQTIIVDGGYTSIK